MNDYNLPKDLEIFLQSGKQLDYDAEATETGEIGIKSLTNKCENYDPEFLLLWLPNEKLWVYPEFPTRF
jgi:hypothetical protein